MLTDTVLYTGIIWGMWGRFIYRYNMRNVRPFYNHSSKQVVYPGTTIRTTRSHSPLLQLVRILAPLHDYKFAIPSLLKLNYYTKCIKYQLYKIKCHYIYICIFRYLLFKDPKMLMPLCSKRTWPPCSLHYVFRLPPPPAPKCVDILNLGMNPGRSRHICLAREQRVPGVGWAPGTDSSSSWPSGPAMSARPTASRPSHVTRRECTPDLGSTSWKRIK